MSQTPLTGAILPTNVNFDLEDLQEMSLKPL